MTLSPERRQSRRSLAHNPGLSCNFQAREPRINDFEAALLRYLSKNKSIEFEE